MDISSVSRTLAERRSKIERPLRVFINSPTIRPAEFFFIMAEKLGGFQDLIRLIWVTYLESLTRNAIRRRNQRYVVFRNVLENVDKAHYQNLPLRPGRFLGPGF